jgi:pentatricopeptide repeat protein
MSYKQLEEPSMTCLKCNREYTVSDNNLLYGLFRNERLMRCAKCFEEMKHKFWLSLMEQGA